MPRPVVVPGGPVREDMSLFANAGVHADVAISLYMRTPDDPYVAFVFGTERFTLEFSDVESLERVRDLAEEGAHRLRAAFERDALTRSTRDGAAGAQG
jgi:hypothetical protein